MRLTLRALSALLRYPDEAVQQGVAEISAALEREALLSAEQHCSLEPLLADLASEDLLDLQERYVAMFDRGRAVSLHLFEHVHGESRDRGQAMVDLRSRYEAQGLDIAAKELPDYLPLFLEYLSVLPLDQAADELAQPGLILSALAERLEQKGTPYAGPMRILAELAGAGSEAFEIASPDDPDNLAELDAAWEEEQVRFDPPAAPDTAAVCPQASAMIARMRNAEPNRSTAHG